MTPLHNGRDRPLRGATGEIKTGEADTRTLRSDGASGKDALSVLDDARPVRQKKRAKRRQRGRSKNVSVPEIAEVGMIDAPKNHRKRRKSRVVSGGNRENENREVKQPSTPTCSMALRKPNKGDTSHIQVQPGISPVHAFHVRTAWKRRSGELYAALDLGTNNCRLLIATPTKPGHFRVIDAFSRIVRLGEGISRTNRLGDEAMERAIEALKICGEKLAQCDIPHKRLIATEACRAAENGAEFIARVHREAGLDLEVVDRETEARLAVSGCGALVERDTNAIVLFDIGGGSSEIALIDISQRRSPRLAEHIIAWTSLPVGVVTLAERFGGERVSEEDFANMRDYVASLLNQFSERNQLGDLVNTPNFHLLGTSGTVTTLAGIHLKLERYDRRRVDGMWMKSSDVTRMTEKLLSWDMEQRVANPCIGAERADLVLAGCAILEAIRGVWPSQRLRVADRGLREGILTELMSRNGAWRKGRGGSMRRHVATNGRIRAK